LENADLSESEIRETLGLKAERLEDFLNALVSMGHLRKEADGRYGNTEDTKRYCCKSSAHYIGEPLRRRGDLKTSSFNNLTGYVKGDKKQTLSFA
jgi:hypothetical protein